MEKNRVRCVNGHEFSGANLLINSKGYRECRTCGRERSRRNREEACWAEVGRLFGVLVEQRSGAGAGS